MENPFDLINERLRNIERTLIDVLDRLDKIKPVVDEVYYKRDELAAMLKCDLSTIHNWTKKGKLKAHYIGARCLYLKSEIDEIFKQKP